MFILNLATPGRRFELRCESAAERLAWARALRGNAALLRFAELERHRLYRSSVVQRGSIAPSVRDSLAARVLGRPLGATTLPERVAAGKLAAGLITQQEFRTVVARDAVHSEHSLHHPGSMRQSVSLKIWAGTWNMGEAAPPALHEWLPPDQDMYAVGVQE